MYAIVEVGGMQWKVKEQETIRVPLMEGEPGGSVDLDQVLLVVDNDQVELGQPYVSNAKVKATVISHGRAKKILVFKKKRRKNYNVLKGHRQGYTEIRIDKISTGEATKKKSAAPDKTAEKPKSASGETKEG